MEMASAAGLRLVPSTMRNPLLTTTYGVGEMIRAALDLGAERILFGCGDSGTNDGGAGMLQALGAQLLRADGIPIERGGIGLLDLTHIDLTTVDPRLLHTPIDVACNPHNWLCGAKGVARIFGPQKGASPEIVQQLEDALEQYANVILRDTDFNARTLRGGGASGGLGTGLSLLGATLYPRFDIVTCYLDLERALAESDLVITAEGSIDFQTPNGKIPAEVARRAKMQGLPVIAVAGTLGKEFGLNYAHGIDAMSSMLQAPCTLPEAILHASEWLINSIENTMRTLIIGMTLTQSLPHAA
jgi:glycerate 2-kinase